MKVNCFWIFIIIIMVWSPAVRSDEEPKLPARITVVKDTLFSDYKNFYSLGNLGLLGAGLGMGAVLDNTSYNNSYK